MTLNLPRIAAAYEEHPTTVLEWTHRDRSDWKALEFIPKVEGEKADKVQWVDADTGYDCLMVRNGGGAWCGYVGVPPEHPWSGLGYGFCTEVPHCGETYCHHSPESKLAVHGGLTFADSCHEPTPELWERWRKQMQSRVSEAKEYPQGDAARDWREQGKYMDDYEGWKKHGEASFICHVPREGRPANVWWFGFDTSHCDDIIPAWDSTDWGRARTYKTREYVEGEVKALALQLKEIANA